MGPAQREPLPWRTNDDLNGRQRHKELLERIEGACLGDPRLRFIVAHMINFEGKNLAEVAIALGIPA